MLQRYWKCDVKSKRFFLLKHILLIFFSIPLVREQEGPSLNFVPSETWESSVVDIPFTVFFTPLENKNRKPLRRQFIQQDFWKSIQDAFTQYLSKLQKSKEFLEKAKFFPLEMMKVVTYNAFQKLLKLIELKNTKIKRLASKRIFSIKRHPIHTFLTNNCLRHCQHTPNWKLFSSLENFFSLNYQYSWNTFEEVWRVFSKNPKSFHWTRFSYIILDPILHCWSQAWIEPSNCIP